jgi:acyl-CoA thioesterase-1
MDDDMFDMKWNAVKRLALATTFVVAALLALGITSSRASAAPVILVLGDSLSAEYGLARGSGWVSLLEDRLKANKFDYNVVNASISGETTSGGKTRLPALLTQHKPALVVVELGANDALRGMSLTSTQVNLRAILKANRDANARSLVIGMRIPPNYGQQYTERFFQTFGSTAKEFKAGYVPFLLERVVERPDWFQQDRIHPNAAAQTAMLDTVWPHLLPMLKR